MQCRLAPDRLQRHPLAVLGTRTTSLTNMRLLSPYRVLPHCNAAFASLHPNSRISIMVLLYLSLTW